MGRPLPTCISKRSLFDTCEYGERALVVQSFLCIDHEAPLTGINVGSDVEFPDAAAVAIAACHSDEAVY